MKSPRRCFQEHMERVDVEVLASPESMRFLTQAAPEVPSPLADAVVAAAAFSSFFAETMARDAEALAAVLDPKAITAERTKQDYIDLLGVETGDQSRKDDLRRALSRLKRRELLRIGVREFAGIQDIVGQCRELSALAEAAVEIAFRDSLADLVRRHGTPTGSGEDPQACGFVVVAMGKLGGFELNFSSDLDLLFVYGVEGETTGVRDARGEVRGRISHHHFYSELGAAMTRAVSEATKEGTLFRIDLRLRPEGTGGAVSRSITGYESYFAQQARAWEKVAYLKARPIAGDVKVGALFSQIVEAFIYEDNHPDTLLPEIARLKDRIDAAAQRPGDGRHDIKRGPGGIREIEFLATAQQLLHGGRDKSLRMKQTTPAIARLAATGRIPEQIAQRQIETYWFYRRVEHALQMAEEKQTHLLPLPGPEAQRLADAMAYPSWKALESKLTADRKFIRSAFEETFGSVRAKGTQALADYLESGMPPPEDLLEPLKEVGLADAEGLAAMRVLAVGTREVAIRSKGQKRFEELLPHLLRELHHAAVPTAAVHNLTNFMRAHWSISTLYDLLLAHPPILRLLVRILGFGALPARLLIARPQLFDEMLETDVLRPHVSPAASFSKRVAGKLESMGLEESLKAIREWKEREALFCAAREILGILEIDDAAARVTEVAESCLGAVCSVVERTNPPGRRWCILGMGGFGGRQVHVCADLDIACFVEDDDALHAIPRNQAEVFFSTVISTMSAVSPQGTLWKMDARLRPEGVNGPLAVTLERATRYYESEAGTWELQSATRARFVAGDESLAAKAFDILREAAHRRSSVALIAEDVLSMRERLETSLRIPGYAECDLKRSPGGLVDIEFLVQFLLLTRSKDVGDIIIPCTREALARLSDVGILDEETTSFIQGHRLNLRTLQRTIRLLRESARDFVPLKTESREEISRALAFMETSPRDLLDRLPNDMRRMREIFASLVRA